MKQNNWTASTEWSRKRATGGFDLTGKCDWKRDRKSSTWRMCRRFAAVLLNTDKRKMLLKYLRCSRWYCLWYYSEQWGHNTTSNKKSGRTLLPTCLQSWTQVNFAGILAVKTDVASVAGDFCSHIRRVLQAVLTAMSQVARRHMRTKLYARNFLWPIFLFQIKNHTHTFHLIEKVTIWTQLLI